MYVRTRIAENAARLRALYAEIDNAFQEQPHGPRHTAACAAFHANYDSLAFPGGLRRALRRLKRLEPEVVEESLQFLEADPWFFCSGYIKEEIVRRLKQARLCDKQRHRLMAVVVRSLSAGTRRVALHLARLAPLVDSPSFRQRIDSLAQSEGELQFRAMHVLDVLLSQQDNSRA